jgi:hypothetical protein
LMVDVGSLEDKINCRIRFVKHDLQKNWTDKISTAQK